nr:hypothetical protein [Kibdelosporangium sp. MJ126-NF4]
MPDDTMAQIADIIVGEHADPATGALWTQRMLDTYPGCVMVISLDVACRWALVRVRG